MDNHFWAAVQTGSLSHQRDMCTCSWGFRYGVPDVKLVPWSLEISFMCLRWAALGTSFWMRLYLLDEVIRLSLGS